MGNVAKGVGDELRLVRELVRLRGQLTNLASGGLEDIDEEQAISLLEAVSRSSLARKAIAKMIASEGVEVSDEEVTQAIDGMLASVHEAEETGEVSMEGLAQIARRAGDGFMADAYQQQRDSSDSELQRALALSLQATSPAEPTAVVADDDLARAIAASLAEARRAGVPIDADEDEDDPPSPFLAPPSPFAPDRGPMLFHAHSREDADLARALRLSEVEVLSEADHESIGRLVALGFEEPDARRAYLSQNKNVDAAANALFSGQ